MIQLNKIINADCIEGMKTLPDNSIDCCVTSPPYFGLRDYGHADQIGLEETPELFVEKMVEVFTEVKRILKKEGTLWLNLGDSYSGSWGNYGGQNRGNGSQREIKNGSKAHQKSYDGKEKWLPPTANVAGLKPKDLIGIPWQVAFNLRSSGWYLRQDIIWHKPNPMPESVTDRCTKSHEYIFLLSKSAQYYFDYESIQELATGFDYRKDTLMKGSSKYKQSVMPGQQEHSMASKGHERWKFKGTGTFGNRDGKLNGLHSGKNYQPKFKDFSDEENTEDLYPIRNKRSVWSINTIPYLGAHFATFPEDLIVDMIKAGCHEGGIILDPFMGAGTTALVASKLNRNYVGFELNADYIKIAEKRLRDELGMFNNHKTA